MKKKHTEQSRMMLGEISLTENLPIKISNGSASMTVVDTWKWHKGSKRLQWSDPQTQILLRLLLGVAIKENWMENLPREVNDSIHFWDQESLHRTSVLDMLHLADYTTWTLFSAILKVRLLLLLYVYSNILCQPCAGLLICNFVVNCWVMKATFRYELRYDQEESIMPK